MPKGNYTTRLTDLEVLELVDSGKYLVNILEGTVYSGKTGQPLFSFTSSKRSNVPWVRLYASPKMRSIALSVLVWIVGTRSAIPDGFQIHHEDRDQENNAFFNLYCLHPIDHSKRHNQHTSNDASIPF